MSHVCEGCVPWKCTSIEATASLYLMGEGMLPIGAENRYVDVVALATAHREIGILALLGETESLGLEAGAGATGLVFGALD